MKKRKLHFTVFVILITTFNSCFEPDEKAAICDPCLSPTSYEGYRTYFSDEFNGSSITEQWNFEEGNGCPDACGYGSGELQFYDNDNVKVRDGYLVITAEKGNSEEKPYLSGRINTQKNMSLTYGRIDVRAKLPKGQGMWAGIWLLGNNISELGWPKAGHISIAEMRGGEIEGRNNTIVAKILWGESNNVKIKSDFYSLNKGIFNDKFHVFSIIWEPTKITWLLNNQVYFEQIVDDTMIETFNKPFHLILNLAVGGQFPGDPDNTTIFPQELIVDYIRIFQKQ